MSPMLSLDVLLQVAAAGHDTLLMKQVVPERGLLDQITAICGVITTVALTVFCIVAVPAAWRFRGTYKKVNKLLEKIEGDIAPIVRHGAAIADNVHYITTTIRTDVQRINATVVSANERVHQAVEVTEDRLNEFNALMKVVQSEAEHLFVSTASTVRGIRTGTAAFQGGVGMDFASDELGPDDLAEEIERQLDSEEVGDGYDGDAESAAEALSAAPRIRPRARGQRRRAE